MADQETDGSAHALSIARARQLNLLVNEEMRTGLERNLDVLSYHHEIVRLALAAIEMPPS